MHVVLPFIIPLTGSPPTQGRLQPIAVIWDSRWGPSGEDGALCTMSRGLLLLRPIATAAFTAPHSSVQERHQISALHCLASVARSARPEAAPWLEEDLRDALFDNIHQDATCAEALWRLLQRSGISFLELRIAVYRLLSGLSKRGWLAEEVCSCEALLTWLLNPEAEPSSQGSHWRYCTVLTLARAAGCDVDEEEASEIVFPPRPTVHSQDSNGSMVRKAAAGGGTALLAARERLSRAASLGPYGAGRSSTREAVPEVAVAPL